MSAPSYFRGTSTMRGVMWVIKRLRDLQASTEILRKTVSHLGGRLGYVAAVGNSVEADQIAKVNELWSQVVTEWFEAFGGYREIVSWLLINFDPAIAQDFDTRIDKIGDFLLQKRDGQPFTDQFARAINALSNLELFRSHVQMLGLRIADLKLREIESKQNGPLKKKRNETKRRGRPRGTMADIGDSLLEQWRKWDQLQSPITKLEFIKLKKKSIPNADKLLRSAEKAAQRAMQATKATK